MGQRMDPMAWQGLTFFGRMVASVSHEIKNCLAIINESAGLIEDLTLMAEKGVPIAPQRLRGVSDKVGRQVKRTDRILRNLNRFAHSIDEPESQLDLADYLPFMAALCERFAVLKGVALTVQPPDAPLGINTSPFWLQYLFWLCLHSAIHTSGQEAVGIRAAMDGEAVWIEFSSPDAPDAPTPALPAADGSQRILEAMEARLEVSAGRLRLRLPARMTAAGGNHDMTTGESGAGCRSSEPEKEKRP
jgi:hypothetical protein